MKRFGKLSLAVAAAVVFGVAAFAGQSAQAGGWSFSFGVGGPSYGHGSYGHGCHDYGYRPAHVHAYRYHRPHCDWDYYCPPSPCYSRPHCW